MLEITIIGYLGTHITAPVYAEIPADKPERFVVVEKMGGERENYIDTSAVSFRSFGPSLLDAMKLNEEVMAAVETMTDLDEICCCEYGGDFNDSDTASKQYCYQAMYNITYY